MSKGKGSQGVRIFLCGLFYQALWFALVGTGGSKWCIAVLLACSAAAVAQLYFLAKPLGKSLLFVGASTVIGIASDVLLSAMGVQALVRVYIPSPMTPVWMIGLWIVFSAFIRAGLDGFRGRYVMQFLMGFIFAPLAWFGGVRLGALEVDGMRGYVIVALVWGLLCLIIFRVSDLLQEKNEEIS
ncbi:hypothetical protein BVX97_00365 [bacterium E08(2017)]|nr:hypothetical protein BVX97_00365 [bacterium E08(2017)]